MLSKSHEITFDIENQNLNTTNCKVLSSIYSVFIGHFLLHLTTAYPAVRGILTQFDVPLHCTIDSYLDWSLCYVSGRPPDGVAKRYYHNLCLQSIQAPSEAPGSATYTDLYICAIIYQQTYNKGIPQHFESSPSGCPELLNFPLSLGVNNLHQKIYANMLS